MIASENFVPQAVLEAAGSVLTNKYAEGYPGKRYYGGCEEVDVAEQLAIDRAKELFGAEHANVQPHSGAQANNAVYSALLEPGDTFLGLALDHGGHLSHGMKLNVSGKLYNPVAYHVDRESYLVDMDEVAALADEHKPEADRRRLVRVPAPARLRGVPRDRRLGRRAADGRHGALRRARRRRGAPEPGRVRRRRHDHGPQDARRPAQRHDPLPRGARRSINRAVFPGNQGGPLMHVIAAKAVAMKIAATEEFRERQRQTIAKPSAFADELIAGGVPVLTGGTDVHLVLVDVPTRRARRRPAEERLEEIGITVNRNAIPFDERPPMNPPGLRIGTPALTTRGLDGDDMREIARVICSRAIRRLRGRARGAEGADEGARRRPPALPRAHRSDRLRIWVDCTAAAHPVVLRPVIELLRERGHDVAITARSYGQTEGLLERLGLEYESFGTHGGAVDRREGARRSAPAAPPWPAGPGPRRFDLAIAHGSVDVAAVGSASADPAGADAGLRVRRACSASSPGARRAA